MAQVIHIYDAPTGWKQNPDYVYIGRYNSRYGLQRSLWHNPYTMRPCPAKLVGNDYLPIEIAQKTLDKIAQLWDITERQNVINAYAAYLKYNEELQAQLYTLQNKILVCWCAPLACHGDVLVKAVENNVYETVAPIDDLNYWFGAKAS